MFASPTQLRRSLRRAGISSAAIEAAWPEWWSEDASASSSAGAELRFTLARRLGLSPTSLLREEPVFLWRDEAKYKGLRASVQGIEDGLTSFGLSFGGLLLECTNQVDLPPAGAIELRNTLLRTHDFVDLRALLLLSWGIGIPVVQLKVFPLDRKHIHAMTVGVNGRFAIMLAKESSFAPELAFTLAHELGHVFLNHFGSGRAIVDIDDPVLEASSDHDELEANSFALELLTGHPDFETFADRQLYNSAQLAAAATSVGENYRIDPGMIALSLGYQTKRWPQTFGALKELARGNPPRPDLNRIAESEMNWRNVSGENEIYLRRVLGLEETRLA